MVLSGSVGWNFGIGVRFGVGSALEITFGVDYGSYLFFNGLFDILNDNKVVGKLLYESLE